MKSCELGMVFKKVDTTNDPNAQPEEDDAPIIIKGYANTVTRDRSGDVIPASTWKNENTLKDYLKNPIILGFHDHKTPIGKMVDYQVTELGLEITVEIYNTIEYIYKAVKNGILKTFSIGFWLKDFEYNDTTDSFVLKDIELYEISVVSVPCNQDSVFSLSKSMSGAEFLELRDTLKNKSHSSKPESELIKLARALNCIKEK